MPQIDHNEREKALGAVTAFVLNELIPMSTQFIDN